LYLLCILCKVENHKTAKYISNILIHFEIYYIHQCKEDITELSNREVRELI